MRGNAAPPRGSVPHHSRRQERSPRLFVRPSDAHAQHAAPCRFSVCAVRGHCEPQPAPHRHAAARLRQGAGVHVLRARPCDGLLDEGPAARSPRHGRAGGRGDHRRARSARGKGDAFGAPDPLASRPTGIRRGGAAPVRGGRAFVARRPDRQPHGDLPRGARAAQSG